MMNRVRAQAGSQRLRISPAQARALRRLIRHQIAAYAESEIPEQAAGLAPEEGSPEPFTGVELDTVASLLPLLDELVSAAR